MSATRPCTDWRSDAVPRNPRTVTPDYRRRVRWAVGGRVLLGAVSLLLSASILLGEAVIPTRNLDDRLCGDCPPGEETP